MFSGKTRLLALGAGFIALVMILASCTPAPNPTNTAFYLITRGTDTTTSTLVFVNEFSAVSEIGDTGHSLISIKVDPVSGNLYATTRETDAGGCNSCLVTLNTTTGAATVVGDIDTDADANTVDGPVPSIAFLADGSLFGWSEADDDVWSIDKASGAATVLGDSGVSSYGHGMWVDDSDTLWFLNGDGYVYTIDTGTGVATQVHAGEDVAADSGLVYSGDLQIRGDVDPDTGEYWGVSPGYGTSIANPVVRAEFTATVGEVFGIFDLGTDLPSNAHNLAFVR